MEERESSVASSVDFYETESKPTPAVAEMRRETSLAKRKAEDVSPVQEKKLKLQASSSAARGLSSCARLPPQVWQHVFSFCSLADLGRLIQVNRSFLSYLTDVRSVSAPSADTGRLHLLKSESLWASVRNALPTKPPKPLPGFTELQMWQLAWSKRCQFCNKLNDFTPGERIWQKGPGDTGVRTVWPFAVRACGPCLLEQCQTDSSLLFSAASALRPALPFALLTSDRHYITAYTLQSATTPANIEIGKYYYTKHVEDISRELNEALSLGPAAAEEWSKGLDVRGKERMRLAENWERWEVKHQWHRDHQDQKRATSAVPSLSASSHREPSRSPPRRTKSPVIHAPTPATPSGQHAQGRPTTVPPQNFTPQPTGSTAPGGQRNLHDANEAKATRKSDIERRCQQLDPPIAPNILRHMDSFRAAIQISQPMTDDAWSVLEPRLLAQLPAAQQAEADHVSRVASLPTRTTDRRHPDANSKEAREVMDREWEESQRPIRDKLNDIADDFINQDWDRGNAITYENSPKFAADLLAYVRSSYYADSKPPQHGTLGTNGTEIRPKLVLDNMKWVYDNKVKPLTEPYRKEIFICYGSGCESNTRFYGFEGVIQHYGAKHTNTFSAGNVVVAWREAEWPEEPPYHPDPVSIKHTHHASSSMGGYGAWNAGFSRAGTSTPHMHPHLPQTSPGPYGYAGQYNGPFAPPQTPIPGYGYPQPYAPPMEGYAHQTMGPPVYGSQPAQQSYMPSPALINPAIAPPPAMPPPSQGPHETVQTGMDDAEYSTSSFDKQVSTVIGMTQDSWKQTSGIKDLPNSLRIYVLLHRVISKFQVEFNHEPNLNHFIDALSNHEMPKALKNAPGLSCNACQIESSQHLTGAYYSKSEERKTYTVLNLLTHFKGHHLLFQSSVNPHGHSARPLDWKEDMIELPSERFISGLIHAPGMDDEKLLMIATVFPKLFPTPLPKIGVIDSHRVTSPASSGSKDAVDTANTAETTADKLEKAVAASSVDVSKESSLPPKALQAEYDQLQPAITAETNEVSRLTNRKRSYDESPPAERRQRYYTEPRYYHPEDGFPRPREYLEYAPSPRIIHTGPAYDEYTGRRTVFRDQERMYGPPAEQYVYTHQRDSSHGNREFGSYPRQVRYYGEHDVEHEYHYADEPRSREASPRRGQSAADRFLDNFTPGQASTSEQVQPPPLQPDTKPVVPPSEAEDTVRRTPPPPAVPRSIEPETQVRPLAPPHPRAPSTVSNGSRYEDPRHNPAPDASVLPRRSGPQRRRDRPQESRMPSRFYRYMSVARDEYGRGSSMSRSQSRRYEEQRRRIDQQETPQPSAENDYEPAYSRDHSVDQPSPEDGFHPPVRRTPREYVSVQDRYHPYSPPRFRYDEPRGPQPVYVDEYGHAIHEYEVVRVGGFPRQPRGPYMSHQPARYEPEPYGYAPAYSYERPTPQRYNNRPEQYMYLEESERERPPPRRHAQEPDSEVYEPAPPGPEIKVESVPVPMPDGP